MQRQELRNISPRTGSTVPYGKPKRERRLGGFPAALFGLAGLALIATAGVTAFVPELPAEVAPLLNALDRAGLDKGPLALFGLLTVAAAFAMRRSGAASPGAGARGATEGRALLALEERVAETGQALDAIHAELAALRQELHSGLETTRASSETADAAANDRVFRLAASLDQLGAFVDQRMQQVEQQVGSSVEAALAAWRPTALPAPSTAAFPTDRPTDPRVDDAPRPDAAAAASGSHPGEPAAPAAEPESSPEALRLSTEEELGGFMEDLRALPHDLLDTAGELAAMAGDAQEEVAREEAAREEGLRLIDRMEEEHSTPLDNSAPPLFPGMGTGDER